jgi:hypothetical protein
MEVVITGLLIFGTLFLVFFMNYQHEEDPRDSTPGRWGIKAGKIVRGEFGGEKWGEKNKSD